MATVTGLTADRMLAIEAASVVDGDVVGDNLILTKHDGSTINAGNVRGPQGDVGPVGSDLVVITAKSILDVGLPGQVRAGRQLTATDFTSIGLSAPAGLWNLSDLADSSGNGRALLNKNAVTFAPGINGAASTAAQFRGASGTPANDPVLYIPDTGANDSFRIKHGTFGAWVKTAKRATNQIFLSKWPSVTGQSAYYLGIINGVLSVNISTTGTDQSTASALADVCDDRWHFLVGTYDGTVIKAYVDGILETYWPATGSIFGGTAPLNIGGFSGDASTAPGSPHYGRIDEAFVTGDVLTEDQIRYLYCVKIPHTLAAVPTRLSLNVRRRRRGSALVVADFPSQPARLYNFTAGSVNNEGGDANGVADGSTATLRPNGGTIPNGAGADGTAGNGVHFNGSTHFSATDVGLPQGLSPRTYGCWFKTIVNTSSVLLGWGTIGTGDARLTVTASVAYAIESRSAADMMNGPGVTDGSWHFVAVSEDNAAADGLKRKMYLDGRLVASSTVMNAITGTPGANRFRIGANPDGTGQIPAQVDGVFVYAGALTAEQIFALFVKSGQALIPSPKNVGDHVEGMTSTDILAVFDALESATQVDLKVAA